MHHPCLSSIKAASYLSPFSKEGLGCTNINPHPPSTPFLAPHHSGQDCFTILHFLCQGAQTELRPNPPLTPPHPPSPPLPPALIHSGLLLTSTRNLPVCVLCQFAYVCLSAFRLQGKQPLAFNKTYAQHGSAKAGRLSIMLINNSC